MPILFGTDCAQLRDLALALRCVECDDAAGMGAKIREEDLSLACLSKVLPMLDRLRECGTQRDLAGNRQLFFGDYCKSILLFLFNPMIDSLRMLMQAAELPKVCRRLGIKRFSLGSFSESVRVFEPELLKQVIGELVADATKLVVTPELARLKHLLTIVDGTLLATLPKLASTLCHTRKNGKPHHAWRLHMHLPIDLPVPELIVRTSGSNRKECTEREQLRQHLLPGRCYVLDRGFHEASLLNDIDRIQSSYVCRVRNNIRQQVLAELPVSTQAQAAGVLSDQQVQISTYGQGHPASDHPMRLIVIRGQMHPKRSGENTRENASDVILVTNLMDEPAELIGTIYRYRWTIELFFRMLKQLLGCRHLLSHRGQGVDIQLYCAVIACLLIYLQTGTKPNKYMMFMMGMYLCGVASEQDLMRFLNRPDNTGMKKRAKDELWKKLGVI